MRFKSECRNCDCLHYYGGSDENYPVHCYCVTAEFSNKNCPGYAPKGNLEYLEWILYKRGLKI
jgi:hypothetical protein